MLKRILALALCLCLLVPLACAEESAEEAPARDAETEELLKEFTLKHGSRSSKKIALTVDDCYKSATEWIEKDVELCREYGIAMTFFPLVYTGCLQKKYLPLTWGTDSLLGRSAMIPVLSVWNERISATSRLPILENLWIYPWWTSLLSP